MKSPIPELSYEFTRPSQVMYAATSSLPVVLAQIGSDSTVYGGYYDQEEAEEIAGRLNRSRKYGNVTAYVLGGTK